MIYSHMGYTRPVLAMGGRVVEYFEMPEVPGRPFFQCEKLRAKLSVPACAHRWRQASHPQGAEQFSACVGCSIGAGHAGEAPLVHSRWYRKPICVRCARPSSRLINHRICPSCYNRAAELARGVNAKGTLPIKLMRMGGLSRRRLRYCVDTEVRDVQTPLTLDMTEAVLGVLRSTAGRVSFSFNGAPPFSIEG